MAGAPQIGGAPAVVLQARDLPEAGPAFTEATVLPGRGMMLLQARLRLPSGEVVDALHAPPLDEAARELAGGADDFAGNRAFAFGGALLIPYANRIRGRDVQGEREIEALIDGRPARLPRNWGGKAPGAAQYAMHGLILDAAVPFEAQESRVRGRLAAGDFGGRWPGKADLDFEYRLEGGALVLRIDVRNVGAEPLPLGVGWHPYFQLPSGDRRQARLRVAADLRTEVNDYDEVLPTGRLLPTEGTPYDFGAREGLALGDLYLDDCFTALRREAGEVVVELRDPAASVGVRIRTSTPQVKAVQVYAPPGQPFVVVEPQFNLAEPYADIWPAGVDTGMAQLQPGENLSYEVRLEAFAVGT
ncbi:aldose 1-epimerase [Phenylobacterium sp.]|jgi:galactose mutarotase-like enzyme|uniref:aldose 1-epimerase n=1 Tax=Phenylobacterium sp. TaxID=1871053 RepID=UPI002F944F5F